jgi:hypothetical protein
VEYPNWFKNSGAELYFSRNLFPYIDQPLECLQIGAYTGDATEWLFQNILTHPDSKLIDVDTWEGSAEPAHDKLDWSSVEELYLSRHQKKLDSGRLTRHKQTSDSFFISEAGQRGFHFIYIDGGHEASQVLRDGLNAVHRVGVGGIVAFDDYLWTLGRGLWADPKPAIDAIATCYSNEFTIIDAGTQVWLKRTELPR